MLEVSIPSWDKIRSPGMKSTLANIPSVVPSRTIGTNSGELSRSLAVNRCTSSPGIDHPDAYPGSRPSHARQMLKGNVEGVARVEHRRRCAFFDRAYIENQCGLAVKILLLCGGRSRRILVKPRKAIRKDPTDTTRPERIKVSQGNESVIGGQLRLAIAIPHRIVSCRGDNSLRWNMI